MNTMMKSGMKALPAHTTGYKRTLGDCMPEGENTYDHLMDDSRSFLDRVNTAVAEHPLSGSAAVAVVAASTVGVALVMFLTRRKRSMKS
ncbi:MAG: hypothetical protein JSS89_12165 [Bacteroidetes bacterium]|nr:hypothetical protein [Bacteroidota bacterium]